MLRSENAGLDGQLRVMQDARARLQLRAQGAEEEVAALRRQLDESKASSDVAAVSADICKAVSHDSTLMSLCGFTSPEGLIL